MNMNPDFMYPVGTYYTTEDSNNPSRKLGGTWTLVRRTYGGELLAYGVANNTNNSSEKSGGMRFSDLGLTESLKEDYSGQNVLEFYYGTWLIHTRGIVGMVKANAIISGQSTGNVGFWWGGTGSTLPDGVQMSPITRTPLLGGGITSGNYGGCLMPYQYRITPGISNVNFYVNPTVTAYNGSFIPGNGGVGISLQVEVFAATGLHYIWKRTA